MNVLISFGSSRREETTSIFGQQSLNLCQAMPSNPKFVIRSIHVYTPQKQENMITKVLKIFKAQEKLAMCPFH